MKTTNITACIVALLWVSSVNLAAQEKEAIDIGARLRVAAAPISTSRIVGTLAAWNGDTLFLQTKNSAFSAPLAIPRTAITRLEVNRGKGSRGKSALVGSAIGFFAAIPATWIVLKVEGGSEEIGVEDVVVGSLFFGAGGIVLGGVVGSLFPRERWEDIPVERIDVKMLPPAKSRARERKERIVFAGGFGAGNTAKSSESRTGINTALRLGFDLSRSFTLSADYEINDRRDESPLGTDLVKNGNLFIPVRKPKVFSTRYIFFSVQANVRERFFIRSSAGLGTYRTAFYWPVYGALDPNTRRLMIERYEGNYSSGSDFAFGLSAGYELIRMRALSFSLEGTYRKSLGENSSSSRRTLGMQGLVALRF